MDANNFVAPNPNGGFDVFFNGSYYTTTATQNEAENTYNSLMAGGGGGGGYGGGGDYLATLGQYSAASLQVQLLNQEYLRQRLNQLEIPAMQTRTELERKQLAMQSALSYSQMMGWVIAPGDLENSLAQLQASVTYNVTWPDGGTKTMTVGDLRDALQQAGYPNWQNANAQELQQVFTRTSGAQVASQMGPVGTGIPTFERELAISQALAAPQTAYQGMTLAGLSRPQILQFLQQSPLLQGIMQRSGSVLGPSYEDRNIAFAGRQLPVQQTLEAGRTNSPLLPFLGATASYLTGQTPEQFFGEFESFLPKGTTAPITGVA